jgi:hypothetical protein
MSTTTAKACLYPAISAMAALAICPIAQAQPDRQCYQTTARQIYCVDLSAAAYRDCYLVPQGPRCPPTLTESNGRFQLPNGQWALPIPKEQWPPPSRENKWPDAPPEGEQPAPTSEQQQPRGTRRLPDWDFTPER